MTEQQDNSSPRPEVVTGTVTVVSSAPAASGAWGLVLAAGVVAAVFGLLVLANIWASVRLVAVFAGLFLLFAGILQFFWGGSKTWRIVAGVIAMVAGVALIICPEASIKTVAVVIGLAFLISGIAIVVAVVLAKSTWHGTVVIAFGVALAAIGLIFMIWPGPTVTLLMVIVGLAALVSGVTAVIHALSLRRATLG